MTQAQGNILIVDDQVNNLRLLADILSDEGYKIRKVMDGSSALDAAQLHPPDLILLDIMMPGLDGYQVCKSLKEIATTRDIPVIFLSALDDIDDKMKAFSFGGVDFITKPFRKEEVIARVKIHLKIQDLTQNLRNNNLLLAQEIEQRKSAELELKQALVNLKIAQDQIIAREKLAALGNLTAGIAHELRNPLNFVNNYSESSIELAKELLEEVQAHLQQPNPEHENSIKVLLDYLIENSESIFQHGKRAERIINSMMKHARMDNSSPQMTDINALLDESLVLAYHSKRVQNFGFTVTIHKDFDPTLEPFQCLATELSRAFINLLDNAFYELEKRQKNLGADFVPTLFVTTRRSDHDVRIRIRDNGPGIEPGNYNKIFEPFFTTKPPGQGTGLGLSMTYEIIVSLHKGTMKVETESGVFTEFILTLPLGS